MTSTFKACPVKELYLTTHPSWHSILLTAIETIEPNYLDGLCQKSQWLPGSENIFAAFSLPVSEVRYILLGESPYPRPQSANGFAFWDAAVSQLWSEGGFSKAVNRATSLRNWLKMLLNARGDLRHDFSKEAVHALSKDRYIQTAEAFFKRLIGHGFLLLNATLVYEDEKVSYHAKHWAPFMDSLFNQLAQYNCNTLNINHHKISLLLLGNIAKRVKVPEGLPVIAAEHPYNLSFIQNQDVISFFKPFDLLAL